MRWCKIMWMSLAASALLGPLMAETVQAAGVPASWHAVSATGPWVAWIEVDSPATTAALSRRVDVWQLIPTEGRVQALLTDDDYRHLASEGFALALDDEATRVLGRLGVLLEGQDSGIPGFPCYRTVEETYATAEAIVAAHPDLASWIDIGDSWEKVQDAADGYDLFVLKLTHAAIPGPKPVFFAGFAIHAREYTTAELGTRFAEFLVDGYDVDADITWLLDHHEVHLVLQANPDGRKRAETGTFWRKNVNDDYCTGTSTRGADLNRNFDFEWDCCGGSSGSQCSEVYRGPTAGSEPEIQALQNHVRAIFPDQRGAALTDPAPDDATGVAMDIHSSGQLVIWPWGFTSTASPNGTALATLGRKLAFFNGHFPLPISQFTIADGSSVDFYYGDLGVAGIGYELGSQFFESCSSFETNVVPGNIDSLFYAAKVARTPYQTPAGPEARDADAQPAMVAVGALVTLTATLDDTRFSDSNGSEPTQTIASAEAFVDVPPWAPGAVALPMTASDGTFDEPIEAVERTIDTAGLGGGRHMLFVRGTDSAGNTGVVAAAFLVVDGPLFEDGFETGDTSRWDVEP